MKTQLSNAVFYDNYRKILVVDKVRKDGTISTILPGGKIDDGENHIQALKREIKEELGTIKIGILKELGEVEGISPTSNLNIKVKVFKVQLLDLLKNLKTEKEVTNLRFLSINEICNLNTTTKTTIDIITNLLNNEK